MASLSNILAVVAVILFVFAIKRLGKVRTSRQGNAIAAMGMLVAVVAPPQRTETLESDPSSPAVND